MQVKYGNYGNYSSNNYGVHSLYFKDVKGNTFYFSYDTLIAFEYDYKTYNQPDFLEWIYENLIES